MGEVLTQLPALVGVVVGTLGTMLVSSIGDRAKWRRERSARWDERRLQAYIAYATALKEILSIAMRMTASHRATATAQPISYEAGLERLAEAGMRRTTEWEAMLLLGDVDTVEAARTWWTAIMRVERMARALPAFDMAAWHESILAAETARDGFYVAARAGLDVGPGSVAQQPSLAQQRALRRGETTGEPAERDLI